MRDQGKPQLNPDRPGGLPELSGIRARQTRSPYSKNTGTPQHRQVQAGSFEIIFQIKETNQFVFIIMELANGHSLKHFLNSRMRLKSHLTD